MKNNNDNELTYEEIKELLEEEAERIIDKEEFDDLDFND